MAMLLESIMNQARGESAYGFNPKTSLFEDSMNLHEAEVALSESLLATDMRDFLQENGLLNEAENKSKTLWTKTKELVKRWWAKAKEFVKKLWYFVKSKIQKMYNFLKNMVVDTIEVEVIDIADYQRLFADAKNISKTTADVIANSAKSDKAEILADEAEKINALKERLDDLKSNKKLIKLNKGQVSKYGSLMSTLSEADTVKVGEIISKLTSEAMEVVTDEHGTKEFDIAALKKSITKAINVGKTAVGVNTALATALSSDIDRISAKIKKDKPEGFKDPKEKDKN